MKLFKNILESIKPHFIEGGKLEKMYPAYDAFETFLFTPDHTTKSGSHIRDGIDLKRTMITVLIALKIYRKQDYTIANYSDLSCNFEQTGRDRENLERY